MEILTHALVAMLLARAGQRVLPSYGAAMLLVSGVASDLDFFSYLAGPSAFLRLHRSVLHSVLGSAVLVCGLALVFRLLARRAAAKNPDPSLPRLSFFAAFAVCAIGVVTHVIFDLLSGIGVQLLWPFQQKWTGLDLVTTLDPWILLVLLLGLALPQLLRLVSEEIGERSREPRGRLAAIMSLSLLLIYFGARAGLHGRAVNLLNAREYHGAPPLAAGAFPSSVSPFAWRGVVSTENEIDVAAVSLAAAIPFDPDRTKRFYKPEDSAALQAAQNTAAAKTFLNYARFPLGTLERNDDAYIFTLRDLRFAPDDNSAENIVVRIELSQDLQIRRQEFRYASGAAHEQ